MPNRRSSTLRLSALALAITCGTLSTAPSVYANAPLAAPTSQASKAIDFRLPVYAPNSLQVHKSPNDPSEYRALRLPNGLQVLLTHNPKADRAAASMTVDTGSADDPIDVPGLAHFNEHMLFLGTDKYPAPTDYQDFLKNHGGEFNASTASQATTYFFDIPPAFFEDALARYARFFIAPKFNADYVEHERHAVDSEYHMRLRDDARRTIEVLGQAFNPEHPFTKFSVGSLDTLKDGKVPLRQRLLDFYQQHYDANVMHLALVGPESLDKLEALARSLFSEVPNRHLSPRKIEAPLFVQGQLPAQLEVQTLERGYDLSFYFPVPDPQQYARTQPDAYLAGLIGHEGPGSILAALRKAGWANGLSAGTGWNDRQHALFVVSINLTPEGTRHQEQIQATLFAYIGRLRQSLQEQWRYDEQALLQAQQYPFLQVGSGADRATDLSAAMSLLPLSEINVAPYRMDRFDPALIQSYLDRLTPNNLLRTYTSPDVKGDQRSRWYDTAYSLKRVTAWPTSAPLAGLALPRKNEFIAENFSLGQEDDEKPRPLIQDPGLDLWYQGNKSFGSPSTRWRIQLLNPEAEASTDARQGLLKVLLASWLTDRVSEALYPATIAGQSTWITGQARGIELTLSGWRDKQPQVLTTLLEQLRDAPIEPASFARIHQQLEEWLANRRQQVVASTLMETLDERLLRPSVSLAQGQDELARLSLEDLRRYRESWLKSLHAQVLVVGNLSEQDARKGAEAITRQLAPTVSLAQIPKLQALQIAAEQPILRPDSESNDSAALSFRLAPDASLKTAASWAVLGQILSSPFYSELRTRQQLGYVVGANYRRMAYAPGLYALVQSPGQGSDELFRRMDAFFQGFSSQVNALDEHGLQPYQQAVTNLLLQRPQNLDELTDRQERQLILNRLTFDYSVRLADAVNRLNPADIRAAWQALLAQPQFKVAHDKGVAANEKSYSLKNTGTAVPE